MITQLHIYLSRFSVLSPLASRPSPPYLRLSPLVSLILFIISALASWPRAELAHLLEPDDDNRFIIHSIGKIDPLQLRKVGMNTLPTQAKLRKAGRGEEELSPDEQGWKCEVDLWQDAINGKEPPLVEYPGRFDDEGNEAYVTFYEARELGIPSWLVTCDTTEMTKRGKELPPKLVTHDAFIFKGGQYTEVSRAYFAPRTTLLPSATF